MKSVDLVILLFSYLLGAVPFGLLISKLRGVDIRRHGSGNIGATNVLRNVGKKEALITLLADIGKGAIPVVVAAKFSAAPHMQAVSGFLSVVGHNFPVYLKFRGGKGVATSLGVMLAYYPPAGAFGVLCWLVVAFTTKYSSLSALIAFGILPLFMILFKGIGEGFYLTTLIGLMIILRHHANIRRLIKGTEPRIGEKRGNAKNETG